MEARLCGFHDRDDGVLSGHWLLNALNQDQKQVVASYFNPIKLAENAPAPKGLKDLTKKEPTQFEEIGRAHV